MFRVAMILMLVGSLRAADYYASPSGSMANPGTEAAPWTLDHALTNKVTVSPGDTVWMKGGTYGVGTNWFFCTLIGTSNNPITVRQVRGETAIVDGMIYGYSLSDWVTLRDFQVTGSSARTNTYDGRPSGIVMLGTGYKCVNLFINKAGHPGIAGGGGEVYGCVIWGVGTYEYDYITYFPTNPWHRGSGLYLQAPTSFNVENNISGGNINAGMKAYSQSSHAEGFVFKGNCNFHNNGEGIEVEGIDNSITNVLVAVNLGFRNLKEPIGYFPQLNTIAHHYTATYTNNYVHASPGAGVGAVWAYRWRTLNFLDNTIITTATSNEWTGGSGFGAASGFGGFFLNLYPASNIVAYSINRNSYYGGVEQTGDWYDSSPGRYYHKYQPFQYSNTVATPTGTNGRISFVDWTNSWQFDVAGSYTTNMPTANRTWLLTNKYELGRANLYVMNWQTNSVQSVDLSTIGLTNGQVYEVRDAQNFAGTPLIRARYNSSSPTINVSLTETTVDPIGPHGASFTFDPNTHSSALFNAFVIMPYYGAYTVMDAAIRNSRQARRILSR